MGAIHGIHYTGFIGGVYRRFPFPEKPDDFKQKAEGERTRDELVEIIEKFARSFQITFVIDQETEEVSIGPLQIYQNRISGTDQIRLAGWIPALER